MQSAEPVKIDKNGVVLSFGVFDGVHIGHQVIISHVVSRARALGIEGVIITFDPHPALSTSGKAPPVITTVDKKKKLMKELGIDKVVIEDFNERFSQLSPEDFVRDILIGRFHAREIVVGYDCAFGKDRAGDKWLLKKLGEKYGSAVDVMEPYELDGQIVSSTRVRTAISQGDFDLTFRLLGRQYSISGPVVPGKGIGRKIGYATANLQLQDEALPPPGVYAVKVRFCERQFNGILNMGTQPTFGSDQFRIEVHLLDFNETIYGQNIEGVFVKNIRNVMIFASAKELAEQIEKDVRVAREILS